MELETNKIHMRYDVDEQPPFPLSFMLSLQHVFAMFGATILVPIILGMSVSVALFCSGIGTLVYAAVTKGKVPVYLGSSFAFIGAMQLAIEQMGGDISASQTGIMMAGFFYVLIAIILRFTGTDWVDRLLPPIVIGPMIIVIGLSLANSAVVNAGLVADGDWKSVLLAAFTFLVCALINTKARGFMRVIPFLVSMLVGYLLAVIMGMVDFSPVIEAPWFAFPDFSLPFSTGGYFNEYEFYLGPEAWAVLPVAIVTLSEHIGDHTVLSEICGRNFIKEPGLDRTLMGDGLATALSGFLGGPANTTYGENTGVVSITRVASTSVIRHAAVLAIIIAFLGKFTALISTIPGPVLGGMSILLYGSIASNGLKVLVQNQVDFSQVRNLIIASAIMVLGLGGAVLNLNILTLSSTALAAITGILLNIILPKETSEF